MTDREKSIYNNEALKQAIWDKIKSYAFHGRFESDPFAHHSEKCREIESEINKLLDLMLSINAGGSK